ncbi:MAG: hypothetical protein HN842_08400 [Gammaproteobacteria bacterium]|nr:hypothetical protein [Gammaproteobacteria bacterium]
MKKCHDFTDDKNFINYSHELRGEYVRSAMEVSADVDPAFDIRDQAGLKISLDLLECHLNSLIVDFDIPSKTSKKVHAEIKSTRQILIPSSCGNALNYRPILEADFSQDTDGLMQELDGMLDANLSLAVAISNSIVGLEYDAEYKVSLSSTFELFESAANDLIEKLSLSDKKTQPAIDYLVDRKEWFSESLEGEAIEFESRFPVLCSRKIFVDMHRDVAFCSM